MVKIFQTKCLIKAFFIIFLAFANGGARLNAQTLQATMTSQGNMLIVKIRPTGGNVTTGFGDMEFFIRYPNTTTLAWGTPVANTTDFPNNVIQKNAPYLDGMETGFTIVRFFLPPGTFTTSKTYTNGTEYEVFRVSASGVGTANIEMMHRNDFTPYYLTLSDETATIEWTGAVKFYGTGASGAGAIQSLPLTFVVPLELTNFTAKAENAVNKLNWETKSERDLNHFTVEKASDDTDKFIGIGDIKANGNAATPQYYSLTDAQPSRLNYYRLKMVDNNGHFTYSKTVALVGQNKPSETVDLYPNPTNDAVTIQVGAAQIGSVFTITDAVGKQILNGKLNNAATVVDIRSFAAGVYFLKVGNKEPLTLVKQ